MEENNIKNIKLLVIFTLFVALVAIFNSLDKEVRMTQDLSRVIYVSAEAEKTVIPDAAKINFTMIRTNSNLEEATNSVNERISDLLKNLEDLKIEEKDIKTKNYAVYPEYSYDYRNIDPIERKTFLGYKVSQSIEINILNLENVEKVLSLVSDLNVDSVSGPDLYVSNEEEILENLRAEAIEKAKVKKEKLEDELGIKLSKIVSFSEGSNTSPYAARAYQSEQFSLDTTSFAQANIPVGESELKKSVTITYQIGN